MPSEFEKRDLGSWSREERLEDDRVGGQGDKRMAVMKKMPLSAQSANLCRIILPDPDKTPLSGEEADARRMLSS